MTDLTLVRSLASDLSLSEATVDTAAITDALAALKQAMLGVTATDPNVATWLSEEHFAGGVIAVAATMNKRAEGTGRGAQFNLQPRSQIIDRFNAWAAQFVERIDAVMSGRATAGQFLPTLAAFRADPINNAP